MDGSLSHREDIRTRLGEAKIRAINVEAQKLLNYQFPIQIIQERTYSEVAEIFALVNSLGTPLAGAEIHLARLVLHWRGITKDLR